eukprot:1598279-Rhodomonas_salina.2
MRTEDERICRKEEKEAHPGLADSVLSADALSEQCRPHVIDALSHVIAISVPDIAWRCVGAWDLRDHFLLRLFSRLAAVHRTSVPNSA